MQLEEVRVRGFRNIEDSGWVDVHEDVTTLVGKNESGKTSFLEAIGRLSDTDEIRNNDINNQMRDIDASFPIVQAKFSGSADRVPENISVDDGTVYKRKDGPLRATNNLGIDGNEAILWEDIIRHIEDIFGMSNTLVKCKKPKLDVDSSIYPKLFDQQINNPTNKEIVNNIDYLSNNIENKSIEHSLKSLKDFVDSNNPSIISIGEVCPDFFYSTNIDTVSDSCQREELKNKRNAPFRRLLELGEINHTNHHSLPNPEQTRKRREAQEKVEERLNQFWDQKSVEIEIDYARDDDEFLVMVQDTELLSEDLEGPSRLDRSLIQPSNRSRGFRWFLSFFVNQVVREDGVDENDDTVYLIDDPAVYLHPEGKKNWLETIENLTSDAQFLYSSHSPFLIDETRPERIRIVEDRSGSRTQITDNIFEGNRETLEPLRNALGIGLGDSPFANRRKILVEGPSDYFILRGVLSYFNEREDDAPLSSDELTLFPVDGADEMPEAGRWMHSEEFAFAFLLDHDGKGTAVEEDIENDELLDTSNLFFLEHDRAKNSYNVEIEDMFHPEFYVDCVNEVYSQDDFCSNIEDGDNEIDDLDLDQIEVTEVDDGWLLNDREEYKGMKIVSKVEAEFSNQGYDSLELDKLTVAKEVQNRLERGDGFREEDVDAFKGVLGPMNSALYAN